MAIYSLNLGFISRSAGRSAVGFSAYISGGKAQDARTGIVYDYGCKEDVIVSRILAPQDAPEWAKDSSLLWNKAEQFEDEWATLRFRGDERDPEKNQKSLEAKEKFLSSTQPAQTIMGALPLEFSKVEAEVCVEEFLSERFVSRGLVVEYAIHWDRGNPHFHGQITRRALTHGNFSQRKDQDIVSKPELLVTRKLWEVVVNKHLEKGDGHEVRIDCRSHTDRGSLFLPTAHEGWHAQRLAEQGQYSRIVNDNEAVRQKNIEILCDNPGALIQEVALKRTTFTRRHLEDEIIRRVGGDEQLFSILKARVEGIEIPKELILKRANQDYVFEGGEVRQFASRLTTRLLENPDIAFDVGENLNRERIFTSTAYKKQEEHIMALAQGLDERSSKAVTEENLALAIEHGEALLGNVFSDEQRNAITHLCTGPDIRILNGKAGTGKTTLLKAVAHAYQTAGYDVMGTSFQGKAVDIMEEEVGIPCRTLDSFMQAWNKHQAQKDFVESGKLWGRPYIYAFNKMKELEKHRLTANNVILVDEANMIGGRLWEPFLEEVANSGAKVLIIQDPAQIKSRDAGDYGRLFAEKFGFCETSEVVRQRVPWQRECSKLLNEHQVLDGLQPYYDKGHFKWFEESGQTYRALARDYVADFEQNPTQTRMALAYQNVDVYELNQCIRAELIAKGHLEKEGFKIHGETYSIGDRVRFTENDNYGQRVSNVRVTEDKTTHDTEASSSLNSLRSLLFRSLSILQNKQISKNGVKNGTFGIILAFDEKKSLLTVALEDKRHVQFDVREYPHLTHGYALGIHKSEGSTFDNTHVYYDPLLDPATLLVGMTRHREETQVYVDREKFTDFRDVIDKISRPNFKETLQDYTVSEEQKPYFTRVQHYRDLLSEGMTLREEMEAKMSEASEAGIKAPPFYKDPSYTAYQSCLDEKKRVAAELLSDWTNHAPYARLSGLRKDVLEVEAGLRPRLLSDLEHRASIQVQGYMDLVKETRQLWRMISTTHPGACSHSHPLYEDYAALKMDRDSLGFVIEENPRLYRPFLRTTQDAEGNLKDYWGETVSNQDRIYISALKSHAEAHLRSQKENLYVDRLSQEQRTHYELVKEYVSVRNEAAAIYGHLQKQKEEIIQFTSPESIISQERFHALQAQRDTLALKLIDTSEKTQEFFGAFNIKEDKLLEHAVSGELREKVQAYSKEQNTEKRARQAQELKRILTTSKEHRIFKEGGLDANRLIFDVAFYDKVKNGTISPDLRPEDVYKPIHAYLESSKESAHLWTQIQLNKKAGEKGEALGALQKDWQLAFRARNDNARELIQNQACIAVLAGMGRNLQSVQHQAGLSQREDSLTTDKVSSKDQHINSHGTRRIIQRNIQNSRISIEQVRAALRGNLAHIATDLLGEPNNHMSNKTALRFGSRGSMVVNITGPKEGRWKDFESGQGGDLVSLVQREKNLNLREAVSYLADRLSLSAVKEPSHTKVSVQPITQDKSQQLKEDAMRLNAVSELHLKSKAIEGTVAEIYLQKERHITCALSSNLHYLPQGTTFMYHGIRKTLQHNCLAAFGRNQEGRLRSVQLTKLDPQGRRGLNSDGTKLSKIHYGIAKESFVHLQEDKSSSHIFIAEGVETALSLKQAGIKGTIVASQGIYNVANYKGSQKDIIICADNDENKPRSQTAQVIEQAKFHFQAQDKSVAIIKPQQPGDDFNDVLKKQGIGALQEYVKAYLRPEQEKGPEINAAQKVTTEPSIPNSKQNLIFDSFSPLSPSTIGSSSKSERSDIAIVSDYVESLLNKVKNFEGYSLGDDAKQELKTYLQLLQRNEITLPALKSHNPELAQEAQAFMQRYMLSKDRGMER